MSTEIGYTNEQMSHLDTLMKNKIKECVDYIMNTDSEGEDFEGDRESFEKLFERVFTTEGLKRVDKLEKRSKKKRNSDGKKREKTSYFIWLWDSEDGMKKIKEDYPDLTHKERLSKAGEIWKSKSEEEKSSYKGEVIENTPQNDDNHQEIEFTEHEGKFYSGLTTKNKKKKFSSLEKAKEEFSQDEEAKSIVLDDKGKYSLRKTVEMKDKEAFTCWIPQ